MRIRELIESKIREVPDWPKKGVSFKDITPLLQDKNLFYKTIDLLISPYFGGRSRRNKLAPKGIPRPDGRGAVYLKKKVDKVVGIDARGFILAAAAAYKLKTGLAIVRKKGKLPSKTVSRSYSLEYASNTLEMHKDSILPGERVMIIDDVLATGGTMAATVGLVKELGGKIIGVEFLIELIYLKGRKNLKGQKIRSLLKYY